MSEEELATVQANSQDIRRMIEFASLKSSGDPFHSDLYINVHDSGYVTLIGGKPGTVTQSYCTFTPPYLGEITSQVEDGAQAIINVADFLTYGLDFASDGGEFKFALRGDPEAELASAIEFYGAVNARVMLKVAGDSLEEVPTGIVEYFPNGDGVYVSKDKNEPLPTHIKTNSEVVRRIIDVVDHDPESTLRPITVEDEELKLDVGREGGRNAVWGELEVEEISGPDAANHYKKGFDEVFKTLSGPILLQTAPDAPLCVAQDTQDGMVLRHVIGNMSKSS